MFYIDYHTFDVTIMNDTEQEVRCTAIRIVDTAYNVSYIRDLSPLVDLQRLWRRMQQYTIHLACVFGHKLDKTPPKLYMATMHVTPVV